MFDLWRDIRNTIRMFVARPAFAVVAVLCLSIGSGANTAMFSVVNAILVRPLPFDEPDRLITVALKRTSEASGPFRLAEYRSFNERFGHRAELLARTFVPATLNEGGYSEAVEAEMVSSNYFDVLRVKPPLGRTFEAADRDVAVISDRLWNSRFRADPSVIGRAVRINSRVVTIVGVAPPKFLGATLIVGSDLWFPLGWVPDTGDPVFGVMGRLNPGVSIDTLQAEINSRTEKDQPLPMVGTANGLGFGVVVQSLLSKGATVLLVLGVIVLSISIANVGGMLLAQGAVRQREFSIRLALGATTGRLVRQLLTESATLALLGGVAGVFMANWMTALLRHFLPQTPAHITFIVDLQPDLRVFLVSVLVSTVAGLLVGLAPAIQARRANLNEAMKRSFALSALMVVQIVATTVPLLGAGLLARSYMNLQALDLGFDGRGVLAVSLNIADLNYGSDKTRALSDALLEQMRTLPGIESVSLAEVSPLAGIQASPVAVTPDYFRTIGVTVTRGRTFTRDDTEHSPAVAVINESMARRIAGDSFIDSGTGRRIEVVGVVSDTVRDSIYKERQGGGRSVFFVPFSQHQPQRLTLLIRSNLDRAGLVATVRDRLRQIDDNLAMVDVRTLEEQLNAMLAPTRQIATLLGMICGFGVILSAIGLYGLVSHSVTMRMHEFGIRIAIGARPGHILRTALGQGMRIVIGGLVAGLALGVVLVRFLASLFFGVQAYDPLVITSVSFLVVIVAGFACYGPARRTLRIDAVEVLRK